MTWQRIWGWVLIVIGGGLAFGSWQDSFDAGVWMSFALIAWWRMVERTRAREYRAPKGGDLGP